MFNLADDVNMQYPNGNEGQGQRKKTNLNNTQNFQSNNFMSNGRDQ